MAQTKARASTKRSKGSKNNKAKTQIKANGKSASGSSASGSLKSRSRKRSPNGKTGAKAIRQTVKAVENTTKEASHSVTKAAGNAKTPLLASGAALAGAAGGLAIGAMRHSRPHKVLGVKMPQPKRVKIRSRDVARAAKEVGTFGQQVGELATELRHAREGNGNKRHRSPIEVVLSGLTERH